MGEPVNVTICKLVNGVFNAETDKEGAMLTQNLVRDREKIKSNELVVTVVTDVLGIYDTKFSVKLEMLRQYGKRVFSEIAPHAHVKSEYHKEISMSLIAEHADSMFHANSMPQPDLGPLTLQRMNEIRTSGFVCLEDLIGSRCFPSKHEI